MSEKSKGAYDNVHKLECANIRLQCELERVCYGIDDEGFHGVQCYHTNERPIVVRMKCRLTVSPANHFMSGILEAA